MRALTIPIAGADYPNKRGPARRFGIALCAPGDRLELRPEPTNPYDEYAIAIYGPSGIQLGYVVADKCHLFQSAMGRGVELHAIFQAASERGGFVRIGFDHIPALPSTPKQPEIDRFDRDFPPDPIWDED